MSTEAQLKQLKKDELIKRIISLSSYGPEKSDVETLENSDDNVSYKLQDLIEQNRRLMEENRALK